MPDRAGADIELLVALLVVAIPIVALAKRARISYPIVLVVVGLGLGFIPHLPKVRLDPDLVLLIFLPPLLYWEAITAPTDVMLENAQEIGILSIGLVAVTTVAVAAVAHAVVPSLTWPVAFLLGAIVSPTDELAAVPVLERFRLPRRVISIVEGESLLNDASALVIYAVALGAATTGAFLVWPALGHFALTIVGSTLIGLAAGGLTVLFWSRIKDKQLQGVASLTLPFVAYLPAVHVGLSGVLAVVTAGVFANRFTPRVMTPAARTQVIGFWNTLVFVANSLLFLIVGLQLHQIAAVVFERETWYVALGSALVVNVAIVIVRFAVILLTEYLPSVKPSEHSAPNWRNALVVAWSGLRGAVSLAAALAIPLTLPGGAAFPHRDLIVFITFSVILVTLVGSGITLPSVIGALHIDPGTEERDELRLALHTSWEAATRRIGELQRDGRIDKRHADALRRRVEHQRDVEVESEEDHATHDREIEHEIIAARRQAIIELREGGEIDNVVLRRVQADLDLAQSRPALDGEEA